MHPYILTWPWKHSLWLNNREKQRSCCFQPYNTAYYPLHFCILGVVDFCCRFWCLLLYTYIHYTQTYVTKCLTLLRICTQGFYYNDSVCTYASEVQYPGVDLEILEDQGGTTVKFNWAGVWGAPQTLKRIIIMPWWVEPQRHTVVIVCVYVFGACFSATAKRQALETSTYRSKATISSITIL